MHFIITFGFSIPVQPDVNIMKDDESTAKVKKKKERPRTGKNVYKNNLDTTNTPKNIIRVNRLLAEIHVEYELLPNYNFKFDCRCWETAAKIYSESNDCCLRPIPCPIKANTCWVIFSVHHLVHLNEMQLRRFFNYVVVFRISYGRQKFSERAKKDKAKGFYIDDKYANLEEEDFLEIYPFELYHSNNSALEPPPLPPLPQPTIIADEDYGDSSIVTYLDAIPDSIHECLFRKMTKKERFPPETLSFESFNATSIEGDVKSSSKNTKKSHGMKKAKKAKEDKRKQGKDTYEIRLPAEIFFSDMGTITNYHPAPELPNISSVLIYAQCQNILSGKQLRMNLNPISIKLEQLSNFPVDTIIENGFKCLYARIFFVDRTIVTPYYVPNTTMCLQFVKCFSCEEFQLEELINFLTTKFLSIEIIGARSVNPMCNEPSDHDKSVQNSQQALAKEEVLLGIAEFDASDLLRGIWQIKLTNNLIHPRNVIASNINYKEEDESLHALWVNSPLTADILTSYGTSMKIKVRQAYDLRKLQRKILRRGNLLNRIFFNLNDAQLAHSIIKDVSSHNSSLLSVCHPSDENNNSQTQDTLKHILTGFVIKDSEKFYIFLEGLSNGCLLKIWENVAKLSLQQKCIYYDSSYIFSTRLYEDFVPLGAVVHVELSESLEMQLRKCSLYIGKKRRTIQANVIKKLGLMNFTLTMKSLCQTRLFPESSDVKVFIDNIQKIHLENTALINK